MPASAHHHNNEPFPRAPLFGAAGLIGLTLMAAFYAHTTGMITKPPTSTPVEIRELRFADRADGGVDVSTDAPGAPVETIAPGTNGFLRATVRGLANQRKREAEGAELPFRLTAWADGRLTLDDPATGRHIELEAFGPTNAAAFARLLIIGATAQ
jgi:putative photosynthetic complex assembly protein